MIYKKYKILLFLLLLISGVTKGQSTLNINSTVFDTLNQTVAGHIVFIMCSDSNFNYFDSAFTNSSGNYSFTVNNIPLPTNTFTVKTYGCGNTYTKTVTAANPAITPFYLCHEQLKINISDLIKDSLNYYINNHKVYFESLDTLLQFQDSTITDSNGFFSFNLDSVIPAPNSQFRIYTNSCGQVLDRVITPVNQNFNSFVICPQSTPPNVYPDFSYYQDSLNLLNVQFLDSSSGYITSRKWYFGDGDSSTATNPVHTYSAFGQYIVKLEVTDSLSNTVTQQDTINIYNCVSSFTYQQNNTTAEFHINSSMQNLTYNWEFGDGTTLNSSIDTIINHTYNNYGSYHVSLYSNYLGCISVYSDTVFLNQPIPKGTINGYVLKDSLIFDDAIVNLYSVNGNNLSFVDSSEIITDSSGLQYFRFPNLNYGTYKVQAKVKSTSIHINNYFPTYYPNEIFWQNANEINLNTSSEFAIIPLRTKEIFPNPGNSSISGIITDSLNNSIQNVSVFLLNTDSLIINHKLTNSNGFYKFENLPFGNYIIYPTIVALNTYIEPVTINSNQINISNLNFTIGDSSITAGINNSKKLISYKVFPNPANNKLFINITNKASEEIILKVYDISGKTIFIKNYRYIPDKTIIIDIDKLKAGAYIININGGSKLFLKSNN